LKKIMPTEISLVILNYQGEPWLGRCLESICAQTAVARLEVVVVDNLSTDKSREICESFRARLPRFQFIANKENLWYCEGNNVGAQAAGSPLLFFLNNDVWLEPDCVERLLSAAASNAAAEIFAARVLDYASDQYQGFGAVGYDWLGCVASVPDHDRPQELFSAYGCAFVIRKNCFERVGGFPAELQAYTDEIDLAWRVWISGGSVVSEPAAKVHHRGAAAANSAGGGRLVEFRTNESKRFLAVRNGLLFWLKNGRHILRLMVLSHLLLLACEAVVWLVLVRRIDFVRRSYLGGVAAAFRMGASTRKWREHNDRIRRHGDFWMLRFLRWQPGRWTEVRSLAKLGWPKVD
jgi:GT2 family glycosyltransferase